MDMGTTSMSMAMSSMSSMLMPSQSSSAMNSMTSMMMSMASSSAMSAASSSIMSMASRTVMSMATTPTSHDHDHDHDHDHGSSSDMSGMDMSSSNFSSSGSMDMDMGMNSYLTRKYKNYPVLFEKLYAKDKKGAFGIFVLILVACFVYKFILFVSWCLEVHWFKKWNRTKKFGHNNNENNNSRKVIEDYNDSDDDDERTETEYTETGGQLVALPKMPNLMYDIFAPSWKEMCHDIIRILLIFTSTMLIYMLMLVVMTFVLTYTFAVITGLTLSEVFFNRCKISTLRRWDIQREIKKAMNCPGAANCKCGRHIQPPKTSFDSTDSSDPIVKYNEKSSLNEATSNNNNNNNLNAINNFANGNHDSVEDASKCVCEPDIHDQDRRIERSMLESARQQEQSNDMDTNLLPAEKFA
ncbi:hypothetical protein C6P45_000158 [Maudiozyma exigua]|uniref:Copper transport protein n=1 Tax=Maudiozyma exigua TaxID=34358 RepID=A0A9P7BAE6_MAUEX|nr:hypothetical protein C6P45_000158 [Kazachstania exigua]